MDKKDAFFVYLALLFDIKTRNYSLCYCAKNNMHEKCSAQTFAEIRTNEIFLLRLHLDLFWKSFVG